MINSHGDVLYRVLNHTGSNHIRLRDDDDVSTTAPSLMLRVTLLFTYVFVVIPLSIVFSSLLLLVVCLTLLDFFVEATGAILITVLSLGSVMSFDCRATYETFIHFVESITGPLWQDSRIIIRCRRNACMCDHHLTRCKQGTCYKVVSFIVGRRVYVLCSCFRRHLEKWVELSGDTNMFVRCLDQGEMITEVNFPLMMGSSMQKVVDLGCGHFDATLLERTYDRYVYSWTSMKLRTYSDIEEQELNHKLEQEQIKRARKNENARRAVYDGGHQMRTEECLSGCDIPHDKQYLQRGVASSRFRTPCPCTNQPLNCATQADKSSVHLSVVTPHESQNTLHIPDTTATPIIDLHGDEKEGDNFFKHSSSSYDQDFFETSQSDGRTNTNPSSSTNPETKNSAAPGINPKMNTVPPPPSSNTASSSLTTNRLPAMLEISRSKKMRLWLDEYIELHLQSDTVNDLGSCFHPLSFSYLRDAFIGGNDDTMKFYHILILKVLALVGVTVFESVRVFQTGSNDSDDEGDAPLVLRSFFVLVIIGTVIQAFPHTKSVAYIGGVSSDVWNMLAKMSVAVGCKLHVFANDHSWNKYQCFGTTTMGKVTFMENVLFNRSVTVAAERDEEEGVDVQEKQEESVHINGGNLLKKKMKKKKNGYMFNFSRIGTTVRSASLSTTDEEQVLVKHWGIVPNGSWDMWYQTIPKTVWVTDVH